MTTKPQITDETIMTRIYNVNEDEANFRNGQSTSNETAVPNRPNLPNVQYSSIQLYNDLDFGEDLDLLEDEIRILEEQMIYA